MGRWIPVEALEHADEPVFISNEEGRVEYCNSAMQALLRLSRREIEGRRCSEVVRLRSPEGKLLCRALCAVQAQARDGTLQTTRPVLLSVNGDRPIELDLLAIAVSPPVEHRIAILHVIKTSTSAQVENAVEAECHDRCPAQACLSPREREVLSRLVTGRGTVEIAGELFLSRATVRNHIRAILSKMKVHSRIEAILASVGRR
jgi:DNA-binding CsgD family transcriptional regulator